MKPDWALKKITSLQSFQRAERILEIGAGDFARSAEIAKSYPDKIVFAIDFSRSLRAQQTISQHSDLKNFNPVTYDCRENIFAIDFFDFSFSIAVGEHIRELAVFLNSLQKTLKPLASYYFIQSPFWTSFKGHHFKHWIPEVVNVLGGYKHLLFNSSQMQQYLAGLDLPACMTIEDALFSIYSRDDLSRLSISETKAVILDSGFEIKLWTPILDECYDPNAAKLVCRGLPDINPDDLLYKGVIAELVNHKST